MEQIGEMAAKPPARKRQTAARCAKEAAEAEAAQQAALEAQRTAAQEQVLAVVTDVMCDENVNARDRLRAAELIGKQLGLFRDRPEHTGKESEEIRFGWSDD